MRSRFSLWLLAVVCCCVPLVLRAAAADLPCEGFVAVNGVRLQYLDWGGAGPALILIPGLGDDPHIFVGIAPALADRFHVITYARRGFGGSEGDGPYDIGTLTEDLAGVMDALGIAKASLVGFSAGGVEMTQMAALHPERVRRIIYLEGAYDWGDPDFRAAVDAAPPVNAFTRPASAMASLDAFLSYQHATWYSELPDVRAIEGLLREEVVIKRDGSLEDRTPAEHATAHLSALFTYPPLDYRAVKCPALAIYAQTMFDLHSTDRLLHDRAPAWERRYWVPFQAKSMDRAQRELRYLQVARFPGAHGSFIVMQRDRLVAEMRQFLGVESDPPRAPRGAKR